MDGPGRRAVIEQATTVPAGRHERPVDEPSRDDRSRDERTSRRRRGATGQSLTELAIVLPIFLLMTLGIVDLARIYSANIQLTDGVRKAALYAGQWTDDGTGVVANSDNWCSGVVAVDTIACPTLDKWGTAVNATGHTAADPANVAYQLKSTGLDASRITLRAPACNDSPSQPSPCAEDASVSITASYREFLLTPILGGLFGGEVKLTASTTARVMRSQ